MKSGEIKNVLSKRFRKVKKHYNCLLEDFNPGEIHDFRLDMKELRAFMRLVNTEIEGKELGTGSKIKRFYRITGNIHNLQLHERRILELSKNMIVDPPGLYLDLFRNLESCERTKARSAAEHIHLDLLEDDNKHAVPDRLRTASIEKYLLHQNNELISILSLTVFSDEALHEIRKLLKDLLFNWDYIKTSLAAILPEYFINRNNVELLATRLGHFHDLCVALHFFKPIYTSQITSTSETASFRILRRKLSLEKNQLKRDIVVLLAEIRSGIEREIVIRNVYEIAGSS